MYNRDSKIMRKLLGKAVSDSSTNDLSITNASSSSSGAAIAGGVGAGVHTTYRPSQSQNAVYPAGAPISRLDVSPDHHAALLAGRHILKTVLLDDTRGFDFRLSEGSDLRAAIAAQQASGTRSTNILADQLNIRDAKWHQQSTIFTACANGRIIHYDVTRFAPGVAEPLEYIQIQEDSRQVNTLDVNPHLRNWLLSGSQDGMARIFDAKAPAQNRSGVLTFRQRFVPLKCIDSVRQVKWSPRDGHEFACCTESGVVMKWDARQAARPLLRINAHDKACTSISWHPDGVHLISAGWDSKLHVWDLGTSADRRQKPKWTISTPAAVAAVAWRPGLWSASARSRRCAQVAVSYDEAGSKRFSTPVVHIWDLARPTMPYKEIQRFESSPSALSWQDQDMLWTVGQDGLFSQCDLAFAPKVVDRLPTSASAFSPRGDALMFLDERPQLSRPRPSVTNQAEVASQRTYGTTSHTQMLSLSRSDSEEDVVGSFLGPRRRVHHTRRASGRSVIVSTTPPSGSMVSDDSNPVMGLEQAIKLTGTFKSQQAMASGHIPAAKSVDIYQYLSSFYLETLERELPSIPGGKSLVQRVTAIMEKFAKAAEQATLFRLAQTWRVLAYVMSLLLKKRAQFHLDARVSHFQKMRIEGQSNNEKLRPPENYTIQINGEETPRQVSGRAGSIDARSGAMKSLLSEEFESTSNVATPLAKPADANNGIDYHDHQYEHGKRLTPIVEPESFDLGPSAHASYKESVRKRLDSEPLSEDSRDSGRTQSSITEGYDFYDTEALAKAIDVPSSHQTDSSGWADGDTPATDDREGSNESFGQMFSISEGTRQLAKGSSSSKKASGSSQSPTKKTTTSQKEEAGSTGEYESRIRGHEIDAQHSSPRGRKRMQDSPEEVFMISQTTVETDDSQPSQTSFMSQSDSEPRPSTPSQDERRSSVVSGRQGSPPKPSTSYWYDPRPHIIESDYLPWKSDPDYPYTNSSTFNQKSSSSSPPALPTTPLNPYSLLRRALDFESRTSALNAAAMILLLKPLVPDSVISTHQAAAILRQQHSRLMGMSLFCEATLLRKLCVRGWPEGLPDWGDSYSAIFAPAQQSVKVAFACSTCHKPREMDPAQGESAIWTCERCRSVMAPCAVCGHRESQLASHSPLEISEETLAQHDSYDNPNLSEWWYCPSCAHGGHASCLQIWHAPITTPPSSPSPTTTVLPIDNSSSPKYSDGCCPLDGCGHACLPGKYRGETTTARADELGRAAVENSRSRGASGSGPAGVDERSPRASPRSVVTDRSVRSDGNDVPQSRAVGMAREALNKGAPSGGILSSSPGRATGERERRKSVKFARKD